MRRLLLIVALAALSGSAGAVTLRETSGLVQVRAAGDTRWRPAGKVPRELSAGDAVRTGFDARAVFLLDGGALLEVSGNAHLLLAEFTPTGSSISLLFGAARISASGLKGRELVVRTPTSTSRARSSAVAWTATVSGGGNAVFKAEKGVVGIEDTRGGRTLLREGQRLDTDAAGLHEPAAAPSAAQVRRDDFVGRMRRELALELSRDEPQRLVAGEVRRMEQEAGHMLTDAGGARVRAEEFLVRTASDRFSFVALNSRRDAGMSYYSWTGVFDRAIPRDLSAVFSSLPGTLDVAAPWTLTSYTATRASGRDTLTERASGGHQVDLNSNLDPLDDVTALYDPAGDAYVTVAAGRPAFQTLFNDSRLYANGTLKRGWMNVANITAQSEATPLPLPSFTANSTFPDALVVRRTDLESYADGTALIMETRAVRPEGGPALRSSFGPAAAGSAWAVSLLREGFQQTVTASEFGGGSVQILFSPRILILTGGLP